MSFRHYLSITPLRSYHNYLHYNHRYFHHYNHQQSRLVKRTLAHATKRISANHEILDAELIATKPDLIRSHLQSRRFKDDIYKQINEFHDLREERSQQIVKGDGARNEKKKLSKQIGALLQKGDTEGAGKLKQAVSDLNDVSDMCSKRVEEIETRIENIMRFIPNLVEDSVPDGEDDSSNLEIRAWGTDQRKLGENNHLWHDEIAVKLGGMNTEAAVRMSGSRFNVLTGNVARLERALGQYFLDFHSDRGYVETSTPYIVSRACLEGTGQLPKFEDDLFRVHNIGCSHDAFLIPTAEVSVTNLYRQQIINPAALPIQHVSLTPCFRAEVGSHGRDTRGMLRQHQFHKVELVKICSGEGDISRQEHEKMVTDVELLLQSLNLPYRVVLLCSGDMGFTARKCYDIEVWLPGQQQYREISSISNCYEYQARRMQMRTRFLVSDVSAKKGSSSSTVWPHTINGSGVAVGRALAAILENYWDSSNNVLTIPDVLRKYMPVSVLAPTHYK